MFWDNATEIVQSGALTATDLVTVYQNVAGGSAKRTHHALSFNAAQSNTIYGNSNTVQPPAICLIAQIKY